jgi:glycosyltransferase involved in cell wall biosynthesis
MSAPSISVVALCRNHERFVAACLRSVFAADQPCELVFADNASTDNSIAVAKETLREAPAHVSTKLIALSPEEPLCKFFNIGVRASSGDFIKPIASDDVLGPNFFVAFRRLVAASEPSVGVWLAGSVMIDADDKVLRQHYAPAQFGSPDDGPPVRLAERNVLVPRGGPQYTAASMFYRRQVYDSIGGYDERFRYEDRPFLFEVLHHGHTVLVHPYNNTYYRLHGAQMSAPTEANSVWMAEARVPILFDHTLRAKWRNKPVALFHLARNVRVVASYRWRNRKATR